MGKEGQPIRNTQPSLDHFPIRDFEASRALGSVVVFRDPYVMSQDAWREIFRTHVFSQEPAKIAMLSRNDEIIQVGFDELEALRFRSSRERRDALNELAFRALDSQAVIFARET